MNRYTSFIGYTVQDTAGQVLGNVTDVVTEDQCWLTVDDSYQIPARGCEEVIDLVRGVTYLRTR